MIKALVFGALIVVGLVVALGILTVRDNMNRPETYDPLSGSLFEEPVHVEPTQVAPGGVIYATATKCAGGDRPVPSQGTIYLRESGASFAEAFLVMQFSARTEPGCFPITKEITIPAHIPPGLWRLSGIEIAPGVTLGDSQTLMWITEEFEVVAP